MLRPFTALSLLVTLIATAPLPAADEAPWRSLFNGRDLDGWTIVGPAELAPVTIEDGAIVMRQRRGSPEHTFVTSRERFDDFILEVELLNEPGFNTGILLRCVDAPAKAKIRLNGYQIKIDPSLTRAWTGGIFDDYGNCWKWMFDLGNDARARAAFTHGEWARIRVECLGTTTKVWVNDVPVTHLIDARYRAGTIAFKIHSLGDTAPADNALRVRNVRILTADVARHARPMDVAARHAPPVADAHADAFQLPPGFSATLVTESLITPESEDAFGPMTVPLGTKVYTLVRSDTVMVLGDSDGDGHADARATFSTTPGATAIASRPGRLDISIPDAVLRYAISNDALVPAAGPERLDPPADRPAMPHSAFNDSQHFPNRYLHGTFSITRASPEAHAQIAFISRSAGLPEVFVRPVVREGAPRFDPRALTFGHDGTLYFSDAATNRLWRIVYTGVFTP